MASGKSAGRDAAGHVACADDGDLHEKLPAGSEYGDGLPGNGVTRPRIVLRLGIGCAAAALGLYARWRQVAISRGPPLGGPHEIGFATPVLASSDRRATLRLRRFRRRVLV